MSDDWSLKGKNIHEPDCERCSTEKIYPEKEIETLRQKLIEQLCSEFIVDKQDYGWQDRIRQETIYTAINELFGVDE